MTDAKPLTREERADAQFHCGTSRRYEATVVAREVEIADLEVALGKAGDVNSALERALWSVESERDAAADDANAWEEMCRDVEGARDVARARTEKLRAALEEIAAPHPKDGTDSYYRKDRAAIARAALADKSQASGDYSVTRTPESAGAE